MIIDCASRTIAAHYAPYDDHVGGCLLGDAFWIGSDKGVVKRPFPHMDPFPKEL